MELHNCSIKPSARSACFLTSPKLSRGAKRTGSWKPGAGASQGSARRSVVPRDLRQVHRHAARPQALRGITGSTRNHWPKPQGGSSCTRSSWRGRPQGLRRPLRPSLNRRGHGRAVIVFTPDLADSVLAVWRIPKKGFTEHGGFGNDPAWDSCLLIGSRFVGSCKPRYDSFVESIAYQSNWRRGRPPQRW
jgi:hypothetical protein